MNSLPTPSPAFTRKKDVILRELAVPDSEYSDASPKGSVDAGIRDLIDDINSLPGFVTTSSCAGRVSVFAEGRKKKKTRRSSLEDNNTKRRGPRRTTTFGIDQGGQNEDEDGDEGREDEDDDGGREPAGIENNNSGNKTLAGIGGKGGGGSWLFVSHDPVPVPSSGAWGKGEIERVLGLEQGQQDSSGAGAPGQSSVRRKEEEEEEEESRLVHFKFEPMILHVLTASLEHAQLLLRCALQAGFRESGAINLLPVAAASSSASTETNIVLPIVAVRSMGLAVESLVGELVGDGPSTKTTVSPEYLSTLVRVANERFIENARRIARFRDAVVESTDTTAGEKKSKKKGDGASGEWEDAQARRERKKAEGLRRKAEKMEEDLKRGQGEEGGDERNRDDGETLGISLAAEML